MTKHKGKIAEEGYRAREWPRFVIGPDEKLISDLYGPGLAAAKTYDRCCSYFSSSVLAAAARGFGPFIERLVNLGPKAPRPAARLLVNHELSAEDVEALLSRRSTKKLEKILR